MKLAIFYDATDRLNVLVPAPNCPLSFEEICAKDVPSGTKYKIIDSSDLPADRTFRGAWEYPEIETDYDGVGA